ncbi:hypothetical protein HQ865_12045 [Mucilaginibacter mali]|uniref:Glycosyltransferase RgtA/B/C/D-like domain-containing protein n=1 Tax=Mucilaginibacter mali TaxID=2740462 RepID=A0A7D4TXK8_9SPHI|nr:hypothetical protein [Mucilaginibacter mali]QKJ30457.1 hypothetical protein HQ865_12045 [Mucilaginibacter mali]
MLSEKKITQLILAATALFTVIMGALIFVHPPALYPDPGWGFKVMRSMQAGSPFNTLISPDHEDIAQNGSVFLSWWSPGQYLVPYFFISVFKLKMGPAVALTISLCSLCGLAGLNTFFKKIGFPPLISAVSIAFIASQQIYLIPFIFYNGGEVILFAFTGWFLYGCCYFTRVSWQLMIFVLLSGVVGFFCKSAFLWIYLAGLAYLWIRLSTGSKIVSWLINGISIGVPAVLSLATIYLGYLSKGDNPAANVNGIKWAWETFCFPLASPLLTALPIDDFSNGIINYPVGITIVLALLSVALIVYLCKTTPNSSYTLLVLILYGVAVLFYSINFLRQANISYEARHMRIIGLVITPGIIYALSKINRVYWLLFALIWLYIIKVNYTFLSTGYERNVSSSGHGSTGLAQVFIDQPTLNYLSALDAAQRNAIFVFITPDAGLEINHNRVITYPEIDDNLQPQNDFDKYAGHKGPLYIVLPKSYVGTKASMYFKNFPGYSNFELAQPGKNYVIYSAK